MPHGWSKPRDLAQLAQRHAKFEFEIPLGDLPGLPVEFAVADEPVRVAMQFSRVGRVDMVHVNLSAVLTPVCQRCLAPMRLSMRSDSDLAVVDSEAAAAKLPDTLESFLASEGHSSLAALAAEELLLALPIVPQHAPGEPCEPCDPCEVADRGAEGHLLRDAPQRPGPQRPFEDLRALLEHEQNLKSKF